MFTRTESFREYANSYRAVTVLILIMMLVFVLVLFPVLPGNVLFYYGTGVNLYIADGQWWRLITPSFYIARLHIYCLMDSHLPSLVHSWRNYLEPSSFQSSF